MQIVNWRTHLKFPEEAKLSPEAKDLINRLLCNVEQRLGTKGADEIKVGFWSWISLKDSMEEVVTRGSFATSGSPLVQWCWVGQTLWNGGSIYTRSERWTGYPKLRKVRRGTMDSKFCLNNWIFWTLICMALPVNLLQSGSQIQSSSKSGPWRKVEQELLPYFFFFMNLKYINPKILLTSKF